ncbi:MAG: hypothetical protein HMLKMBBP_03531 [Planctomycetes bacterium]|nr:hypothetical protein [Planctomycetota bacterium]
MRLRQKSSVRFAVAALAGAFAAAMTGLPALHADDDDDAAASAEQQKLAADELAKAVKRGAEIWSSKDMFKKSCASCHEDANKPNLNMKTRAWSYPAYSRRAKGIVTLHQKIQEMVEFSSRGKRLDDNGRDIAALAAYVTSLKSAK